MATKSSATRRVSRTLSAGEALRGWWERASVHTPIPEKISPMMPSTPGPIRFVSVAPSSYRTSFALAGLMATSTVDPAG